MTNPEIKITPIGEINKGVDGKDQYLLLTRLDDDLSPDFAENWLLPQVYRDTNTPGGYFCHRVTISKLPSDNEVIAIVHHRYDV